MNNEVMIVVDILCETQHYNTVLNAIYKCASESILEDGCERYDVYPDVNDSQKITLVEKWKSLGELDKHKRLPHYDELQSVLSDKVLSVKIETARLV